MRMKDYFFMCRLTRNYFKVFSYVFNSISIFVQMIMEKISSFKNRLSRTLKALENDHKKHEFGQKQNHLALKIGNYYIA